MRCSACGKDNPDTAAFCGQCGAYLNIDSPADQPQTAATKKSPRKVWPLAITVILLSIAVATIFSLSRRHSIHITSNTHSKSIVASQHYSVTNLGSAGYLSGPYANSGTAISSQGTIADMTTDTKSMISTIRFWHNGQWVSEGKVSGFENAQLIAINDHQQALCVGGTRVEGFGVERQHFLWSNGIVYPIGSAGGDAASEVTAFGISETGFIVGQSNLKALLFGNGALSYIDTGSQKSEQSATAISSDGQIAGYVSDGVGNNDFECEGYAWRNNSATLIGYLPGRSSSRPTSINDKAEVVGNAFDSAVLQDADYQDRGFLWRNGVMTDLGSLGGLYSIVNCINNNSQIVGASDIAGANNTSLIGGTKHAFLWQNEKMIDLNNLIPANSGWTLDVATGISDSGQIVGVGEYQKNGPSEFLLSPE